ncbi:MAG TPA: hypothetical protein VNQ54_05080, partial [Methylomirabilota bacterium]|nr:hypothetical protein [Methylomirabilota bacterium]
MKRAIVVLLGLVGAAVASLHGPGSAAPADSPATLLGGSLSADPLGWAFHPTIAVAKDGSVY